MFVLNEGIAARFPCSLVVDYVDLGRKNKKSEKTNQIADTQQDLTLNYIWWNLGLKVYFIITSDIRDTFPYNFLKVKMYEVLKSFSISICSLSPKLIMLDRQSSSTIEILLKLKTSGY